jgi:hypothetical protein
MFKKENGRMYQMPVVFGPTLGPRQREDGGRYVGEGAARTEEITVLYETDGEALSSLLPEGLQLLEPLVAVRIAELRQIPWLAGRGYNLAMVCLPVRFDGQEGRRDGFFIPVLWENHGDPIITGREQIGWSKLYGQVEDLKFEGQQISSKASSWGFEFLRIEADLSRPPESMADIGKANSLLTNPENGFFHYKYIPKTGSLTEADAEYMTFLPCAPAAPALKQIPSDSCMQVGSGRIQWTRPSWKDMPTQCRIVQKLYDLPILRIAGAIHSVTYDSGDLAEQRQIR